MRPGPVRVQGVKGQGQAGKVKNEWIIMNNNAWKIKNNPPTPNTGDATDWAANVHAVSHSQVPVLMKVILPACRLSMQLPFCSPWDQFLDKNVFLLQFLDLENELVSQTISGSWINVCFYHYSFDTRNRQGSCIVSARGSTDQRLHLDELKGGEKAREELRWGWDMTATSLAWKQLPQALLAAGTWAEL